MGYHIPFTHTPTQSSHLVTLTTEKDKVFIASEIKSLLTSGAIVEYQVAPEEA